MTAKKAILTLIVIFVVCSLFFTYLFLSGRLDFKHKAPVVNVPVDEETEKRTSVIELSEKIKALDASTTPEQRAKAVVDLAEKIKGLSPATGTASLPVQSAPNDQAVLNLSEKIKELEKK